MTISNIYLLKYPSDALEPVRDSIEILLNAIAGLSNKLQTFNRYIVR